MASDYRKDGFQVSWNVENFSMFPKKTLLPLRSPSMYAEALNATEWFLYIELKSGEGKHSVRCNLCRETEDNGPEVLVVVCEMSFKLPGHQFRLQHGVCLEYRKGNAFPFPVLEGDIFDFRGQNSFPKSDILTVRFTIWLKGYEPFAYTGLEKAALTYVYTDRTGVIAKELPKVLHSVADKEAKDFRRRLCPPPNRCEAVTLVKMERRALEWSPRNIMELKKDSNEILTATVTSASKGESDLLLVLRSGTPPGSESRCLLVDIHRVKGQNSQRGSLIVCKISLLDIERRSVVRSCTDEHSFYQPEDGVWNFPTDIKEIDFRGLAEGATVLCFEFLISEGLTVSYVKSSNSWSAACQAIMTTDPKPKHLLPMVASTS